LAGYGASIPAKGGGIVAAGAIALAGAAAIVSYRTRAAERAHPPQGKFVTSDGVRLHYIERGRRGAPVVFLHGNGVTAEDFLVSGVLDAASRSYQAYAFDRPGFGHSERPWTRSWPASAQAALLPEAFRLLGIERPIVVGHSWGTMVALALALDHPQALSGLVLASGYYYPTVRSDVALFSPPAIPLLGDLLRHTVAPFVGEAMTPRLIKKMFAPQQVPTRFWERFPTALMTRPSQIRAAAEDAAHMIGSAKALSARYSELRGPVAILAGDADRVVDYHYQAEGLHQEVPHSTLDTHLGVGHMLHHFDVDRVMRAISAVHQSVQPVGVAQMVTA
jgi:pimeloyl-ACP methyl ester carboxylesterase